jgi:hypothetical protein
MHGATTKRPSGARKMERQSIMYNNYIYTLPASA